MNGQCRKSKMAEKVEKKIKLVYQIIFKPVEL